MSLKYGHALSSAYLHHCVRPWWKAAVRLGIHMNTCLLIEVVAGRAAVRLLRLVQRLLQWSGSVVTLGQAVIDCCR